MLKSVLFQLPLILLASGSMSLAPAAPAESKPVDVVFLGDSITKAVRSGVTTQQSFAHLVQTGLLERGVKVNVANVGIGGERTDMALKRLTRDVISRKPRFVTIMYGTNDSYVDRGKKKSRITANAYRDNLQLLVERLLLEGIEPILMTEPRWAKDSRPNGIGENPNIALEPYVEICREVAQENNALLVDHYAHWTKAFDGGKNLREWTTDGCHPNPRGHREIAALMVPVFQQLLQSRNVPVPFTIERSVALRREPGTKDGSYWMHPRAAAIPGSANDSRAKPSVLMVLSKFLGNSDYYSGIYAMRTDDLGKSWQGPVLRKELDWESDGDVNIAVADVSPGWHKPSGKLIAIGAQVRYSPKGKQLEDQPRAHQTAYTVFDPKQGTWTRWRRLEMPAGDQFNFARCACAQWLVEEDGTLLLPCYIGVGTRKPFSTTVVRCRFDGDRLTYVEHGDVLALNVKRGLYEPSLVRHGGRYYLTMRNDLRAYVSVSDDGLHFRPVKAWTFDNGKDLGSYNTQAHWVQVGGGLFLVYTRRGANNEHVMRNRAPLFIAQVDPARLHVIRSTEKILVPERGATLGNSGVTVLNADESWVTVSEANIDRPAAVERGADGSLFIVKVKAVKER